MEWSDIITNEFLKWRGDKIGREGSIDRFAEAVGVPQPTMSSWMKKNGRVPRSTETINKLVNFFGPQVYQWIGLEPPESIIPDRVRKAIEEARAIYQAKNIDQESDEATEILIDILKDKKYRVIKGD